MKEEVENGEGRGGRKGRGKRIYKREREEKVEKGDWRVGRKGEGRGGITERERGDRKGRGMRR